MQRPGNWIRQRPESPLSNAGWLRTVTHGISLLLTAVSRFVPASFEPLGGPISIVLIALVATFDFILVLPIYFSSFYLVLVAVATWCSGRRTGMLASGISFAALLAHQLHRFD